MESNIADHVRVEFKNATTQVHIMHREKSLWSQLLTADHFLHQCENHLVDAWNHRLDYEVNLCNERGIRWNVVFADDSNVCHDTTESAGMSVIMLLHRVRTVLLDGENCLRCSCSTFE